MLDIYVSNMYNYSNINLLKKSYLCIERTTMLIFGKSTILVYKINLIVLLFLLPP
jgi:hypothetical protein